MCRGSEVVVVGGGNSAGQSRCLPGAGTGPEAVPGDPWWTISTRTVSSYLACRIEDTPNIEVLHQHRESGG